MELLDLYYHDSNVAKSTMSVKQYRQWLSNYLKPVSMLFYSTKPNLFAKVTKRHLNVYFQFCDFILKINTSPHVSAPLLKEYIIGVQQISSIIILLAMILKQQPIDLNNAPRSQREKSIMKTFLDTSNHAITKMNTTLLQHQALYKNRIGQQPLALGDQLNIWHTHIRKTIQQRLLIVDQPISYDSIKEPLL